MDVGLELRQKLGRGVLVEDNDRVHAGESRDDLRAFRLGQDRPALPLAALDGAVGVDSDDEPVPLSPGRLEIPDVADVEQVESAVGEDDPPSRGSLRAAASSSSARERIFVMLVSRKTES